MQAIRGRRPPTPETPKSGDRITGRGVSRGPYRFRELDVVIASDELADLALEELAELAVARPGAVDQHADVDGLTRFVPDHRGRRQSGKQETESKALDETSGLSPLGVYP